MRAESNGIHDSSIEGSNIIYGDQNNFYNFEGTSAIEDLGVISEIFKYILGNKKTGKERDRDFTDVNKKIHINFSEHIEEVEKFMKMAYIKLNLIEEIFAQMESFEQDDVHTDIFFRYEELRQEGLSNYNILLELTKQYIPTGKEKNPHYKSMALALVLFFFEDCTWGKKTEKELTKS